MLRSLLRHPDVRVSLALAAIGYGITTIRGVLSDLLVEAHETAIIVGAVSRAAAAHDTAGMEPADTVKED